MDDDNSFSIHDLDHAPEPPTKESSASGLSGGGVGGGGLLLSPRALRGRASAPSSCTASTTPITRRRHSGTAVHAPSTLLQQQQQQQQQYRAKSAVGGVRGRTRSGSGNHSLSQTYYSTPNISLPSSIMSPSTASGHRFSETFSSRRGKSLSTIEVPSHSNSRNFPNRHSLQDPPSLNRRHTFGSSRRSGNNALASGGSNDNSNSSLVMPELMNNSKLPSGTGQNDNNFNEDNDDIDLPVRLEPGFMNLTYQQNHHQYFDDDGGDEGDNVDQIPHLSSVPKSSYNKSNNNKGDIGGTDGSDLSISSENNSSSVNRLAPILGGTGRSSSGNSGLEDSAHSSFGRPQEQIILAQHQQELQQQQQQQQQIEDPLEDSSHNQSGIYHPNDEEDGDDISHCGNMSKNRWKRPTMHQIATFVVMNVYAPFFGLWYGFSFLFPVCCKPPPVARSMRQPTDRAILARLNVLVGFFGLLQIASALFLLIVTVAPNLTDRVVATRTSIEAKAQESRLRSSSNVWNVALNVYLLGLEAFVLVVAAVLTVRVVRNVNLVGAIRYLWVLLWILPFEIYFNIGLYDYFRVTGVWVKQYWRDPSLGWFREQFCEPSSTSNTLCSPPLNVNVTNWCLEQYNSTSCASIRAKAQTNTEKWLLSFFYLNASGGLVLICLLFLVVNTLERIISKPLVRKSRQSNIPAWLSLPIISCAVFGVIINFAQTAVLNTRSNTDTDTNWIGPLYLGAAGLFLISALLGWYISVSSITNTRHKRNKMISISAFILLMCITSLLLVGLFAVSIIYSSSFVEIPLTDSQRGDLACIIDQAGSCTFCNLPQGNPKRCPEWTSSDVTKVIQTQAKSSAALAGILLLYSTGALRFGLGMRKHIRMYQIQYI